MDADVKKAIYDYIVGTWLSGDGRGLDARRLPCVRDGLQDEEYEEERSEERGDP